jgi:hypothetical protein
MTDRFTRGWYAERHRGKRIATVMWNANYGEVDVTISPVFDELDDVAKLDALQDAIGLLQAEYEVEAELQQAQHEARIANRNGETQ